MALTSQQLGRAFELLIQGQNKAYLKVGMADIRKTTARITIQCRGAGGRVQGRAYKGDVDFQGPVLVLGGRMIAFDAKSTKGRRFSFTGITLEQVNSLWRSARRGGAIAFLLVEFSDEGRYFIVPFDWFYERWLAWHKRHDVFELGGHLAQKAVPASITLEEVAEAGTEIRRDGKRLDYLESIVKSAS
jgi:recombination protein U